MLQSIRMSMLDEGDGIGSLASTRSKRRLLARESGCWNRRSSVFCELFHGHANGAADSNATQEAGTTASIDAKFNQIPPTDPAPTKAGVGTPPVERAGVVIVGRKGVNQVVNGRYHEQDVEVGGRPSYAKPPVASISTDRNLAIWWCAGKWTIGVLDEFGSEAGYAYAESDAMRPVNIGWDAGGDVNSDHEGGGSDDDQQRAKKGSGAPWIIWEGSAWKCDKAMRCVRLGQDHRGPLSPPPSANVFDSPPRKNNSSGSSNGDGSCASRNLDREQEDRSSRSSRSSSRRRVQDGAVAAHGRVEKVVSKDDLSSSQHSAQESAVLHSSIFEAVAAGDLTAMLNFLKSDPSLLNVVRSSDGHNLVIVAAQQLGVGQLGCMISLVEHGAAHKYHGAPPHFHGHHLDSLQPIDDVLDALQALAKSGRAHTWSAQEQEERVKLLAKAFARLAPASLPAMVQHIPPLPPRKLPCNIKGIMLALKSHTVNDVAPLRSARALMDLTLPSQLNAVLTMVKEGVVAAIYSVVAAQIERTRLGPTSVLTFITLARYFSAVLCRVAIDVTVEHKVGRHEPRKQCVEEGVIELAALLLTRLAAFADVPLNTDQRVVVNAGKGALLQVLAELSFDLEDTGTRLVECQVFDLAAGVVADLNHSEVATMATWCLFNLLERKENQNQVALAKAKAFARAILLQHPGHSTAEDLLGKAAAPSWMVHTRLRTAACNDDVDSLAQLLLEAEVTNDYSDLHRPDENGKPPIAAAATIANMSPCDSLIMLAERGCALKHHSGDTLAGRHHVEKIASCEIDFELLSQIGELSKPLDPAVSLEREAAIERIRSRFAPPKATDAMIECVLQNKLSREEIDALPAGVRKSLCTMCKSAIMDEDGHDSDPAFNLVHLDPCGCVHHSACVLDWIKGNRASCPLCKTPLAGAWGLVPPTPTTAVNSVEWLLMKLQNEIEDEAVVSFGCRCLMDQALSSPRRARKVATHAGLQQIWRAMNTHWKCAEVQHCGGYVALEAAIQLRNAEDSPYEELVKIAILGIWNATNRGFGEVPTTADRSAWVLAAEINVRVLAELAFSTRADSYAATMLQLKVTDRIMALLAISEYYTSEAVLLQASSFLRSLINAGGELENSASSLMVEIWRREEGGEPSLHALSRSQQELNPPAGFR